jgi:hypothetical protein
VAKFTDETIRAIVAKARYSEPGAADHMASTLIRRRDKVLRAWLTAVNPIAGARLAADGTLTVENAAAAAQVSTAPSEYALTWSRFDNATGSPVGERVTMRVTEPRAVAPQRLLEGSQFLTVAVETHHVDHPQWRLPVTLTFRRTAEGWQAVGLERAVPAREP